MTAIQSFLGSPLFYVVLALIALVVIIVLTRRGKGRVTKIVGGIPPSITWEADKKPEPAKTEQMMTVEDDAVLTNPQQKMHAPVQGGRQVITGKGKGRIENPRQDM